MVLRGKTLPPAGSEATSYRAAHWQRSSKQYPKLQARIFLNMWAVDEAGEAPRRTRGRSSPRGMSGGSPLPATHPGWDPWLKPVPHQRGWLGLSAAPASPATAAGPTGVSAGAALNCLSQRLLRKRKAGGDVLGASPGEVVQHPCGNWDPATIPWS